MISKRPISLLETQLEIENMSGSDGQSPGYLSLEDALDLHLCMSFNFIGATTSKERFNPFKAYCEQRELLG